MSDVTVEPEVVPTCHEAARWIADLAEAHPNGDARP
jgi:hypothetical protein